MWGGGTVAFGLGVVELGENKVVFGPVGEAFGRDDVGQVGDSEVDVTSRARAARWW